MPIDISIDEKACVGCSLCVDICPTKVFDFDSGKALPHVSKAKECFGCLSCSEICPATAIDHQGIIKSENYYHDTYALRLNFRTGQNKDEQDRVIDNKELVANALGDLQVRLLSVAAVLRQTLGDSLPAIGTQAGRSLAAQLPRYHQPQSVSEALDLTKATFSPAWDLNFELKDNALTINVKGCIIREICVKHSMELGGDLCTLLYGYLAGYLSKVAMIRPRLLSATRGDKACTYNVQIHAQS